jgi:hypothetical protein
MAKSLCWGCFLSLIKLRVNVKLPGGLIYNIKKFQKSTPFQFEFLNQAPWLNLAWIFISIIKLFVKYLSCGMELLIKVQTALKY